MVQRSRPVILLTALIIGTLVPLYLEILDEPLKGCVGHVGEWSGIVMGITMALVIGLLLAYMCTLKTTLIFGTPCGPIGAFIHLLGREATEKCVHPRAPPSVYRVEQVVHSKKKGGRWTAVPDR
jgi:hypothetical protein